MILIPHWVRPSAEQVNRLGNLLIGEVPTRAGSNGGFQRALSQEALTPIRTALALTPHKSPISVEVSVPCLMSGCAKSRRSSCCWRVKRLGCQTGDMPEAYSCRPIATQESIELGRCAFLQGDYTGMLSLSREALTVSQGAHLGNLESRALNSEDERDGPPRLPFVLKAHTSYGFRL